MSRKVKDAILNGERIYFRAHAGATYMSDGRSVETAMPVKVSDLMNDAGYITREDTADYLSADNTKTVNGKSLKGEGNIVANAYEVVDHGTGDTELALAPNVFHVWGEVSELVLTFGEETEGVANEFLFQFASGSTPTSLTLPDTVRWAGGSIPSISGECVCQVSILRGMATMLVF